MSEFEENQPLLKPLTGFDMELVKRYAKPREEVVSLGNARLGVSRVSVARFIGREKLPPVDNGENGNGDTAQ